MRGGGAGGGDHELREAEGGDGRGAMTMRWRAGRRKLIRWGGCSPAVVGETDLRHRSGGGPPTAPAAASKVAGRRRPRQRRGGAVGPADGGYGQHCGEAAVPASVTTVAAASARAHAAALAVFGELEKGVPHWPTSQ